MCGRRRIGDEDGHDGGLDEPESFVKVASADPSQTLAAQTPARAAAASTSDLCLKTLRL